MPSIEQLHRDWERAGVTVLLMNLHENSRTVGRVVAERGYTARVVLDPEQVAAEAYGIRATPTAFLVARDGTVVARAVGPRPWTGPDGRALLRALLEHRP